VTGVTDVHCGYMRVADWAPHASEPRSTSEASTLVDTSRDCMFMMFTYDSRPMVDRDAPKLTSSAGMDDEQSMADTSNGDAAFHKQNKAQTVTQ
jgi:hypothetical protein